MLESFLAAVADNAVGATVLAVAVFVVTRLWRNPAAQHVLWLLVLVKLITPCVIPLPFGGITVGSVSLTEIPKRPVASSISSGIEGPIAATKPADRGHQMGVHAPSADAALMDSGEHSLSFFLLLVWMALSGAWLVVAGRRIVQFHRGLKSTAIASTAVQDLARAVANRLGYVSPLEVRIAESQLPPLLWCVGRPKIVLAQGLYSTLGTDELRGILAHEISHLLRRDHWARWLELVVFGAYWWHPVAWWARRELREAEERACDARVLAAWPGTESQYAGALLAVVDLARRPTLRVPAVANSFGNNGSLKRRIETMFERNVPERMTCRAAAIMLLTGMVLLPVSLRSRGAEQSGKTATLAEIREGFTKFEKRILNLSVNSESDVDNHFRNATGGPVPKGLIQEDTYDLLQKCVSTWIVDASGRIWQKHSAQVTAIRADKSEVKHQLEIEAAFDGKGGRWIQTEHRAEGDRVHVREINRPECYGTLSPLDFSLHYVGTPIRQILRKETREWPVRKPGRADRFSWSRRASRHSFRGKSNINSDCGSTRRAVLPPCVSRAWSATARTGRGICITTVRRTIFVRSHRACGCRRASKTKTSPSVRRSNGLH